jgi:leucyl aminopeptidase (aminopeptidase T)
MIHTLCRAVESVQAHAVVRFRGELEPTFLSRWKHDVHAAIVLDEPVERSPESAEWLDAAADSEARGELLDRLTARALKYAHASVPGDPLSNPVSRELIDAGVRTVYFGYPTPERARRLGIDFCALHDACWTALDVDYHALVRECAALGARLAASREIHLRAAGGTDLRFRIDGKETFIDDGIISDWEVEHRRCWNHLPAGKVIVAAIQGTAEGMLHSELSDYLGIPIGDVRLTFRGGEVVQATAEENEELLQRLLAVGHGDARQMSCLEIGMNPQIRSSTGYAVWDSKAYGSATIGVGDNRGIGGTNESDFAWGLRVAEPRLSANGEIVLEHGRFPNADGGR